jgi:hypothetical protein
MTEGAFREVVDNEVRLRREFGWSVKLAPAKREKKSNTACIGQTSKPSTEFEIRTYADLVQALRQRCNEIEISRESLDALAGFPDRYAAKLLSLRHVRRFGLESLGPMLSALGLRLAVVIDDAAIERNRGCYAKRDDAHFRSATARHSRSA